MFGSLFQIFLNVTFWKIDFYVVTPAPLIGMASLFLTANQLPSSGNCVIDMTNGTSFLTWFTIKCSDWIDLDGRIAKYEYIGRFFLKIVSKI